MSPLVQLEHIVDAQKGFLRPLREGREAVANVINAGIRKSTNDEVHIESLCVRTTKINEDPVKIEVVINKRDVEVEKKIQNISCSCPAGASKEHLCKHAMAVLIYLERRDEKELEALTCTDVEQKWGQAKAKILSEFEPVPLRKFCHITNQTRRYRRMIYDITGSLAQEFKAIFLKDQPESEAANFWNFQRFRENAAGSAHPQDILPDLTKIFQHALSNISYIVERTKDLAQELYSECTSEEQDYYQKYICVNDEEALKIYHESVGQCNEAWDNARFGRITGSICYSLYTYSKNKNPNWNKKLDSVFNSSFSGNADTDRGLMYETDARLCYEKMSTNGTGTKIFTPGIFIHPALPWLGYSADGVVTVNGKVSRLFEVKTPAAGEKHSARNVSATLKFMSEGKLKERHIYYGQIQLGMLLSATPICDFSVYCCGFDELLVHAVTLNEPFCIEMLDALAKVYFKNVLPWLCSQKKKREKLF